MDLESTFKYAMITKDLEYITHLDFVGKKAGKRMDHLTRLKKHLITARTFKPWFLAH